MAFLALVALVCYSCNRKAEIKEDEIVVRVGNSALTLDQLAAEIPATMIDRVSRQQIQDYAVRWMNAEVLYQEAQRRGMDRELNLQRELKRMERELVVNALLDKEINARLARIGESQIQTFYETNMESFKRSEPEALVLHIFAENRRSADSLYQLVRSGDNFASMARELARTSLDTASWKAVLAESEVPPAARHIFRARTGAPTAPVELEGEYHIFQIVEKYPEGSYRTLSSVRDEIAGKLRAQGREERYRELIAELTSNTMVETNFQMLESIPLDSVFARANAAESRR